MFLTKISKTSYLLFICSFIVLLIGQSTNLYQVAPAKTFEAGLLAAGDGQFVGKLAYSRQFGLSDENMMFIGQIKSSKLITKKTVSEEEYWDYRRNPWKYSYEGYYNNYPIEVYNEYKTKHHIFSFLASGFDIIFNPDPQLYIKFLKFFSSLMLSLLLAVVIVWISKLTNIYGAIICLFLLAASPKITLISRCLYFTFFTWFFAFIGAIIILHLEHTKRLKLQKKHYLVLFSLMLFHMLAHSFEFVNSVGIMSVTPFILYGLMSDQFIRWFKRLTAVTLVYFVAIGIGIFALIFQIGRSEGGLAGGIEYMKERFELRSGEMGEESEMVSKLDSREAAANATFSQILDIHLETDALSYYFSHYKVFLTFRRLIFVTMLFSVVALLLAFLKKIMLKKTLAILITGWFSITAPISWFFIFPQHCYLHAHFTPITWYTPFVLFCALIIGHSIELILTNFRNKSKATITA